MVFWSEAYLCALLVYEVQDPQGKPIGRLQDVLAKPNGRFPEVTKIAVKHKGSRDVDYYPWSAVRTASPEGIRLNVVEPVQPSDDEIHLRRDLVDKQIVDVSGKRVVRVHDVKLGAIGGQVLLTHADVGWRGVLRRLGWEHFTLHLCRALHIHFPEKLIAWEHLQTIAAEGSLKARETRDGLNRIHPADLADIAEELSAPERAAFLGAMDEEVAADAMQEMDTAALVAAVNELDDQQASDLIDEMDPDAGADLLAELPEERASALLSLMEPEEAQDLRKLLSYPWDSAGGLMTTEYVCVPTGVTAQQAWDELRQQAQEVPVVYDVYVVDRDGRLTGVFSLRDLLVAGPDELVDTLMRREVVSVTVDTKQEDIAPLAPRYNLLAIPVVDDEGRLQGIVTADDAIDADIPTSLKKRIPKAFAR